MNTNTTPVSEQELAAAAVAPRVTPADIEAEIVHEYFFTAEQGAFGARVDSITRRDGEVTICVQASEEEPLRLLTFCVLVLRNGFTVTGESACASPANFNPEIGRRIARENAIEKLWPLLGFRLRDKLACTLTSGDALADRLGVLRPDSQDVRHPSPAVDPEAVDFPLGQACDLSGEGTCEACQ